ncbi:hypothetical protein [Streptomyces stelliscabiei]|uniref:Uncharacterized protein n=1 Tax=Streptomyces stelliscabiei TaxID=146820 RepID=A0A8I0TMX4_9ACTN|nr:hypothetical protein [Streptomyces stelliscabiei]KND38777.1 hypothetical protein IQ64_38305 [Streptomyces stelliscabiei]MBE1593914.1 hypothetical protein [Streptomyces stelliscabiei]MDX2522276.1 hypothetical protein [Streptomyces stelliscabiei]
MGVSGADHPYIKQQLLAWLAGQSITATARLPEDAERLGGEVVFEPGGHGCLRVLLNEDAALPAPADGTQLVLGRTSRTIRTGSPSTATCCASAATPTTPGAASWSEPNCTATPSGSALTNAI